MTYTLTVPWDAPPLLDNFRGHWAVKARHTRELRAAATVLARAANLPRGLDYVEITLVWAPKIKRRRDGLSTAPTLKGLVDGLVDYGLVADDDIGHVKAWCEVLPARKHDGPVLTLVINERARVA